MAAIDPPDYLKIYLQDHHAGSLAGRALVERMAASNAGTPLDELLIPLRAELEQEAGTVTAIMDALGVTPSRVKGTLARVGERLAKLKLNGHVITYSPLSRLFELEGLRAAVDAKLHLFRTLQAVAAHEPHLTRFDLEHLAAQAQDQLARIDHWHAWAAEQIAPAPPPPSV